MIKRSRKSSDSRLKNLYRRIAMFRDWYKLVFPINRLFRGRQKLTLRNGTSIYVRDIFSSDLSTALLTFSINEYHLERIPLPENPLFIDLGANIGLSSLDIKKRFPDAKVIAYEPLPASCELIRLNVPSAEVRQKAAAAKTGTVHFLEEGAPSGLHMLQEGGIVVESESFDDIVKAFEKVDLMKIDIEAAEYELLNAASPEAMNKVQKIVMEVHSPNSPQWAEELLQKHGYKTEWVSKYDIIYAKR